MFGQTDYSNIEFRSYIYKYKEDAPRTTEIGIEKQMLTDIVGLLSGKLYSKAEQTEIVDKMWLALENPKTFELFVKEVK